MLIASIVSGLESRQFKALRFSVSFIGIDGNKKTSAHIIAAKYCTYMAFVEMNDNFNYHSSQRVHNKKIVLLTKDTVPYEGPHAESFGRDQNEPGIEVLHQMHYLCIFVASIH